MKNLSEDDFRDIVVRPLFRKMQLQHGRDHCGPTEKGKDIVFIFQNPLGFLDIYAIQTKKGNLNMSGKASQNVVTAVTQLRTALKTKIQIDSHQLPTYPSKVILCASGTINDAAREHIRDEVNDPRVAFMDAQDMIPQIDSLYPELWYGIDAEKSPYLAALKKDLLARSDTIPLSSLGLTPEASVSITDETYVDLAVYRIDTKVVRRDGQSHKHPKFVEIKAKSLTNTSHRLILLLGNAGDGKSTTLRHIAYTACDRALTYADDTPLPIVIRCIDISSSGGTLVDHAAAATARLSANRAPVFSLDDLQKGRVVILVDGLDEVSDSEHRQQIVDKIRSFSEAYPECKVILASRPYRDVLALDGIQDFVEFRISSFDSKSMEKLVNRLAEGRALPADASKEFMRQLKDVHGITLNPLLITVFVATSDYRRRDIPANITELFKKFTELLLGRWDERKGLAQQYQHGLKDFLLCSVALQMHKDRTTSISAIDFETVITRELRDRDYEAEISICMDEILNRSGLLRRDGDKIEFRHLLFQEFFAGRALQSSEMLSSVIQDEWWRRATVFYFGEHPGGHADLARLIADASRLPPKELFRASVTIGLATQACYLSKTQERKDAIRWVVETFAKAYQIVDEDPEQTTFPLSKFLGYYIEGRDAVATLAIKLIADTIFATPDDMFSSKLEQDLQQFWAIVGLLESGQLADAESLIQDFAPIDSRLLLGIHLGTFLLLNLRIADKGEKKIAERICAAVEPKIKDLHKQLLDEFNTLLIEKRNDKIQPVIEAGGK